MLPIKTLGGGQWWTDRRWWNGHRVQRRAGSSQHHRLLDPHNRRLASGKLEHCVDTLNRLDLPPTPEHLVILLHGLGRRSTSLLGLGWFLEEHGFPVARLDYASTREDIQSHAAAVVEVLANLPGTKRVSLVTHSLGGLVARLALSHLPPSLSADRLVMLAPPSEGAVLARKLDSMPFRAVMGPSGAEIARGPDIPVPTVPFAVIAASAGGPRGLNPLIPGVDDGVVAVEETKLEGQAAHFVVRSLHTTIMDHPEAQKSVLEFLSHS